MRIFTYQRPDGTIHSDYTVPPGATLLRKFKGTTEAQIRQVMNSPDNSPRVRALAERALLEEFPPPTPQALPRTFFGRVRWLFTGK